MNLTYCKVSNPHASILPIIISPYNYVLFPLTSLVDRNQKVEEFYTKVPNYYHKIREIDISKVPNLI